VAAARRCHERLLGTVGDGSRRRFRAEVTDRAIAQLWGCDPRDLEGQAWDRGFADVAALRRIAEPFVAHLKVAAATAPPAEPALPQPPSSAFVVAG
jgi:hypothetical protein